MYNPPLARPDAVKSCSINLAKHFVLVAEEAERLGNRSLAEHFLEIAFEMFDAMPQLAQEQDIELQPATTEMHA